MAEMRKLMAAFAKVMKVRKGPEVTPRLLARNVCFTDFVPTRSLTGYFPRQAGRECAPAPAIRDPG
jgi:hypothetical protein